MEPYMQLTGLEARVIGCLLEKETTTPEHYPLSLNALTLACNQKSSRDPVLELTESEVQETLDNLNKKRLILEQTGAGSRVSKYKHRFCNTEFSELQLLPSERALICLLLLRGPQTPGELRSRSQRLYSFSHSQEVEEALERLRHREPPLVASLAREPGKREIRFMELISESQVPIESHESPSHSNDGEDRSLLEQRVTQLEQELLELKQIVQQLQVR